MILLKIWEDLLYQENKNKVDELNKEIISMNTKNSSDQAKIESYKVEINKLENEINELQTKYINQTSLVEQRNSKKTVLLERRKREIEKTLEENCSAWIEDYSSEIYEEEYQENEKGDL